MVDIDKAFELLKDPTCVKVVIKMWYLSFHIPAYFNKLSQENIRDVISAFLKLEINVLIIILVVSLFYGEWCYYVITINFSLLLLWKYAFSSFFNDMLSLLNGNIPYLDQNSFTKSNLILLKSTENFSSPKENCSLPRVT